MERKQEQALGAEDVDACTCRCWCGMLDCGDGEGKGRRESGLLLKGKIMGKVGENEGNGKRGTRAAAGWENDR